MALGDPNNNNEGNGKIVISHFSEYGSANSTGQSASSRLLFSFYGRTLKVAIAPMIRMENDRPVYEYSKENSGVAYLNHTKARILREAILSMKEDSSISNVGVPTSNKLITFTNGKELGIDTPALIIRELDPNGQVLSTYIYEFRTNNDYYSVNNFVAETSAYDKVFYNNIEVDQFLDLLEQYYKAATGAYAYATTEAIVNCREVGGAIRDIASQVGVPNNTSRPNYSNRSFFNNNNGGGGTGGFRQGTLDSMRDA